MLINSLSVHLVGIVNVTPDSFSDGGCYNAPEQAIAQGEMLLMQGANMLDIGAESTRPGATPLSQEEEWARLSPVLPKLITLAHAKGKWVSVDTRHARTAEKALAVGVDCINDVSGLTEEAMIWAVQHSTCQLVMMHHLGIPADKTVTLPEDCDPVAEVLKWANAHIQKLQQHGIAKERLIFDPGIGFGKTAAQSLMIVQQIERFHSLRIPLMAGHSRKSFLTAMTDAQASERDVETLISSLYLINQKTQYLRVHNIDWHKRALQMHQALHTSEKLSMEEV